MEPWIYDSSKAEALYSGETQTKTEMMAVREAMDNILTKGENLERSFAELLPNEQNLSYDEWIKGLQAEFLETHTGGAVKAEIKNE